MRDGAWYCPDSKKTGRAYYKIGQDSRFEWSFEVGGGGEVNLVVAKVRAQLLLRLGGSGRDYAEQGVDVTISAAWCHSESFRAMFFAGDDRVPFTYHVRRRFHWWVKNRFTGGEVYDQGDIWVDCGSGSGSASRLVPLFGSVSRTDSRCANASECAKTEVAGYIGWFPPLPEGFDDPFGPSGPPLPASSGEGEEDGSGGGATEPAPAPTGSETEDGEDGAEDGGEPVAPSGDGETSSPPEGPTSPPQDSSPPEGPEGGSAGTQASAAVGL
jgi:hypothetical protein